MRTLIVVGLLAVSSVAAADSKDIESTVKTSLDKLARFESDAALGFTDTAVVFDTRGNAVDMTEHDGCAKGAVVSAFYGCIEGTATNKPGAITAGELGDVGWFQTPFTASMATPGNKPDSDPVRFGGVVLKQGGGWKIAAAAYTTPISDKLLLMSSDAGAIPPADKIAYSGDQKVGAVFAGWFKTGFAKAAASNASIVASGTSPAEYKAKAGAVTLAKSWDKLKLGLYAVDVKLLAGGKIGFVQAIVFMPRKGSKATVSMQLYAVVIPDGSQWKWVSLMYAPTGEG